jgi:uncharacterized membrane protein YhaH (DUF805 family)
MNYYIDALKNYATFEGKATRTQFWMFVLVNLIISIILETLIRFSFLFFFLSILYAIALVVPSLAIGARRLHDTGKSGWWQLIGIIPFVGAVILIIMFALPTKQDGATVATSQPQQPNNSPTQNTTPIAEAQPVVEEKTTVIV